MVPVSRHIILVVLIGLFTGSCGEGDTGIQDSTEVPDYVVLATDSGIAHRGGLLYYHDSLFSGYLVEHYDQNAEKSRTPYLSGKKHGRAEAWYPDGMKMDERTWVNGLKEGEHRGWWEDGTPRYLYHFKNGQHEGSAQEWYADGILYRDFNYVKGQEEGAQMMWNADGTIKANYVIRDGRRFGSIGAKPCGGEG